MTSVITITRSNIRSMDVQEGGLRRHLCFTVPINATNPVTIGRSLKGVIDLIGLTLEGFAGTDSKLINEPLRYERMVAIQMEKILLSEYFQSDNVVLSVSIQEFKSTLGFEVHIRTEYHGIDRSGHSFEIDNIIATLPDYWS